MNLSLLIHGYALDLGMEGESERDMLQFLAGAVDVLKRNGVKGGFDFLLKLTQKATISKINVKTLGNRNLDDRIGRPLTWFGVQTFESLRYDGGKQVDTPVDELCLHCQVEIGPEDVGVFMPNGGQVGNTISLPIHRECLVRMVAGSVGHQLKLCPCYGGTMEDPPGANRRQAALAAAALFEDRTRNEE